MKKAARLPVQARLKSTGLSIGNLARLTGVATSAIRYYEACGLLPPPARTSGRRIYDAAAVASLKRILAARALGFSMRDLRVMSEADLSGLKAMAWERAKFLQERAKALHMAASRLEVLSRCDCETSGVCQL